MIKELPYEHIFQKDFLTKILGTKLLKKIPQDKLALLNKFRFRPLIYVDHSMVRKRLPDGTLLGAQRLLNGGYRIIKKAPDWHNYTQRELKNPSINIETADILKQFHRYSNRELLEIIDLLQIVSQKYFIISYTQKTIYYNKMLWEKIKTLPSEKEKKTMRKLFYLEVINKILKEKIPTFKRGYKSYSSLKAATG